MFTELIRLMEKRSSDVKQQLRSQQKREVSRIKELQEKLEQEMAELKRRDTELKLLSHTEDHNQFLKNYSSLSQLSESTELPKIHPLQYFGDVATAVSEVRDKLQEVLMEKWSNILQTVTEVETLLSHQLKTRDDFLWYACHISLDPKTAHPWMILSEGNRKVTNMKVSVSKKHAGFNHTYQVLSKESLTGRCYWEVKWDANITIAVTYKDGSNSGPFHEFAFGYNDKSCGLCSCSVYVGVIQNKKFTPISGDSSLRVGVYLDHKAGILSFYDVGETMKLLHTVQTTFTQPLYAGISVCQL